MILLLTEWDLNSGLCTCLADALLLKPSLQQGITESSFDFIFDLLVIQD
jgi:hypothetical protein